MVDKRKSRLSGRSVGFKATLSLLIRGGCVARRTGFSVPKNICKNFGFLEKTILEGIWSIAKVTLNVYQTFNVD